MSFKSLLARCLALILVIYAILPFAGMNGQEVYAASVPETLFQEDFQDGNTDGWTLAGQSGSWAVVNDTSDATNKMLQQNVGGTEAYATAGSNTWTDYLVQAKVKLVDDGPFPGLIARYKDSNNYYMFRLNPTNTNKLELSKKVGGTSTTLGTVSFTTQKATWYTLKMVLTGDTIRCYIDDKRVFEIKDSALSAGMIGFRTKWGQMAVDDVQVTAGNEASIPASPAAVTAGPATATTVSLTWEPVPDADFYRVYRSSSEAGTFDQIYRGADTSYRDINRSPATAYYYRVTAEANGLESAAAASNLTVSATTLARAVAPGALAATAKTDTTITLSWNAVETSAGAPAPSYKLYRAATQAGPFTQAVYTGAETTFTDTGLTPGQSYYYAVSAIDTYDESTLSEPVIATTDIGVPAAPTGLKQASASYSRTILIQWDSVATASGYKVYRANHPEGPYESIAQTTSTVTAYTDKELTPSNIYYYKVSALNITGESPLSEPLTATTGPTPAQDYTEEQLKANDYTLYFVNAGDPTPETVEGTDKLGLYSSKTEQTYGTDSVTGKKWGLETTATGTNVPDATNKLGSLRYYNGAQVRDKAIKYNFELPQEGYYDITLGFKNPWSGRSVNIIAEGTSLSGGDLDIGSSGAEKIITYRHIYIHDGELNLSIQGPATAALSNYNDPLINYILVQKYIVLPLSDLEDKIEEAKAEAAKPGYTTYSVNELQNVIGQAEAFVENAIQNEVPIETLQEDIRAHIQNINAAITELDLDVPYQSFTPGGQWRDTNGAFIQAHGGGIMFDERTNKYYWYGEDKTNGYLPARGVRVYSSTDLYNWKDEGLALTAIESMEQFDTDPLISSLYAGRADRADIFNDIGTQRIMERPKVIYNDTTGKYVMWMHTDGPSATSTANYAKAEAGYALSDSPTGPFVYGVSNRMDRAPADATYNGQPNQPGMARDMNLFKDDDGTAYLIYSSEENMTIYISKLNDSYTDIVGWHKEGNVERDTTYKAEYGVDYIRVFPGAQREAPAMFKYKGKYYLITSGATGWAPNRAQYTVADSVFGEWKAMRDPSVGDKASTTFDSQSTYVIPVDAAAGKFIFMGDRWFSSYLKDSRYIWLPIEFGQNDEIMLKWYDEWNLELLDTMGQIQVNTELPEKVKVGEVPQLPAVISVTAGDGTVKDTPVVWSLQASDFSKPGTVAVSGTLPEFGGKVIKASIHVIPDNVVYFVHAGGAATSDYGIWSSYMQDTLLNKDVIDQKYDPANNQSWGYIDDNTNSSGNASGDLFSSLRYLLSNSGDDLSYRFDLESGPYSVYVGLYDPWYQYTKGSRVADIKLNGETKTSGFVFTDAKNVLGYNGVNITDGKLELTVHRSTASSPDPQISWIMIVDEDRQPPQGVRLSGPASVSHGQSFQLLYGLSHVSSEVYAHEVTVQYDPNKLQHVSSESAPDGFQIVGEDQATPGIVRLIQAGVGQSVTGDVELLQLQFQALTAAETTSTSVSLSNIIIADGSGEESELPGVNHTVQITVPVTDKTQLNAKITEAEGLLQSAKIGTKWGHYAQAAVDALTTAINSAKAVSGSSGAGQAAVDEAADQLASAITAFQSARVTTASVGDLVPIAVNYGADSTAANWQAIQMYDLNQDGKLDIADLSMMARKILQQE